MNDILIRKIKNALKTEEPIESIKSIISEYDDLNRLYKWRKKILKDGVHLYRYEDELKRVGVLLEEHGYYPHTPDEDIIRELKKIFNKF